MKEHVIGTIGRVTPDQVSAVVVFDEPFEGTCFGVIQFGTVGRTHLASILGGPLRSGIIVRCAKDSLTRGPDACMIGELVFYDPESPDEREKFADGIVDEYRTTPLRS